MVAAILVMGVVLFGPDPDSMREGSSEGGRAKSSTGASDRVADSDVTDPSPDDHDRETRYPGLSGAIAETEKAERKAGSDGLGSRSGTARVPLNQMRTTDDSGPDRSGASEISASRAESPDSTTQERSSAGSVAASIAGRSESPSAPEALAESSVETSRRSDASGGASGERHGRDDRAGNGLGAVVVRMSIEPGEAKIGQTISVQILVESEIEIGHAPFYVTFDPQVLRFDHALEGAFLRSDGRQTVFLASPVSAGSAVTVGVSRLGRVGGISGSGDLCTLIFEVVGPGESDLTFVKAKVRDAENRIVPSNFVSSRLVAH